MLKIKIVVFLFFLTLTQVMASGFKWSGSFKTHLMTGKHRLLKNTLSHTDFSSLTSARINTFYQLSSKSSLEASYDFSTQWAPDPIRAVNSYNPIKYRIKDLENYPMKKVSDDFSFQQNLDRFVINHTRENFDLYLGRQAISKGSGRIVNPTDIFLPFPIGSIDSEFRTGVDALRVQTPFGNMGELDLGLVFGENGKTKNNALFVTLTNPIKKWDLSYSLINYRENWLLGFDLQGSLFSQGFWLEAAYNKMREYKGRDQKYLRAVVGMDYRFSSAGVLYFEYQYNGAGTSKTSEYLQNLDSLSYLEGGVQYLAKNYLGPGISYEITPLWIYSSTLYLNLDDQSTFLDQRLEWNFKENFYMDFSAFLRAGTSGSEFSTYSNRFVSSLRAYF